MTAAKGRVRAPKDAPCALPGISERNFRAMVLDYARLNGWLCYFTWSSIHSPAGFPDLVLVRPPRLIFAELKTNKGKVSLAQKEWIDALMDLPRSDFASPMTYVWRPRDWDEIERVLDGAARILAREEGA